MNLYLTKKKELDVPKEVGNLSPASPFPRKTESKSITRGNSPGHAPSDQVMPITDQNLKRFETQNPPDAAKENPHNLNQLQLPIETPLSAFTGISDKMINAPINPDLPDNLNLGFGDSASQR